MLPDPPGMGTRRSRHQTTIHGKNLLSQCCQACHRASAGGLLRRKPVKPESSHWSRARCVLMWKKEGPGRFPPGRKLCTNNSTNPKAGSPGIMLRLKAQSSLGGGSSSKPVQPCLAQGSTGRWNVSNRSACSGPIASKSSGVRPDLYPSV